MATLLEQIANIQTLIEKLEDLAFGDDATTATYNGLTRDSLAKAIKVKFDALQAMVQGRLTYETKALMDAAGAPAAGELAEVWNDPTLENNGLYGYTGSGWSKSNYDVIAAIQPTTTAIGNLKMKSMAAESGYAWALVDDQTNRAALMITTAGDVVAPGLKLSDEIISENNLDVPLRSLIPQLMNPEETGYVYALVDPVTNRCALRITPDGLVEIPELELGEDSVGKSTVKDEVKREAFAQVSDVVEVYPQPFRSNIADISAKTASADGSRFVKFPDKKTNHLRGLNLSGTSIEIRKSTLDFLGHSHVGGFTITADSINLKGQLSGPNVSTPSGTFTDGDYYQYVNGSGSTSTGTHAGMKVGDVLVYQSGSWSIQAAPGVFSSRPRHAAWIVDTAGYFDGVEYAVGDIIVYIGRQPGGGGWQYERWYKCKSENNDLCFFGEFDPSAGLPSSPVDNAVYQASATASTGGFSFTAGDYVLRSGDEWFHVVNDSATTYASNAPVFLNCKNASEYEFRRTDKSATSVGFKLQAPVSNMVKRSNSDLWLISDSMFGVSGVGATIISDSGRAGVVNSFGGGQSEQIFGMMEYEISTLGDRYAGRTLVAWHGQNNQPATESAEAQIKEASLRMAKLASARDIKCLFLTVLGQRNTAWNGSRLTCSQHEDQFNKTGYLHELSEWYARTFAGQYLNVYEVMLAAATDAADPQFPGMTEKEVANTYGIVPWSFFNFYYTRTWSTDDLNFIGYWTDSGLPTGGSDLDYYVRTANGTNGNLLVNEGGTWVERSLDITHLSPAGGSALSLGGSGFLDIPERSGVSKYINENLI